MKTEEKEPVIIFQGYRIIEYVFKINKHQEKNDFKLSVQPNIFNEDDHKYGEITVKLVKVNDEVNIKMSIIGRFEINRKWELDEDRIEEFLVHNGTAIVYPYMRAAVSMLTSLDSEKAVLLPTLNTNALTKSDEE